MKENSDLISICVFILLLPSFFFMMGENGKIWDFVVNIELTKKEMISLLTSEDNVVTHLLWILSPDVTWSHSEFDK